MAEFPAMPFYTDAYLADTTHLTTEEHGAYLLLLFAAWRSPDCSLKDDDTFLARVAKVSLDRWNKRLKPVMLPFWQVRDGRWTQKKQQSVREKLGAIAEKRAKAARHGREPKPLLDLDTAPANEGANGQQMGLYPKPKTKTNNTPPLVPLPGEDGVCVSDAEFEAWWQAYPRKVGRQAAADAYRHALQEATAEQLASALAAAAARWRSDGIQERYIPHPANWLEQRRWEDQSAVAKQTEPAGPDPVRIQRVSVGATMAQAGNLAADLRPAHDRGDRRAARPRRRRDGPAVTVPQGQALVPQPDDGRGSSSLSRGGPQAADVSRCLCRLTRLVIRNQGSLVQISLPRCPAQHAPHRDHGQHLARSAGGHWRVFGHVATASQPG